MWRILTRQGPSRQRPSRQAKEKNQVAVRSWKQRN
ncbi:MAG: winged helix-turn-helix domain-containing protein [Euryarchaeota archaeon]|nr:winged helix-turn-helix domain-containing protein [Euryarchaeota archaeon]MDE1837135.1 winged helix-turn-helix domain-containing protein [Euryarchaeota archaeon]MDE1879653.1 winged helix-turn-helix domain-containing protein [Euryarchaeota archaeon]MDE2045179.1 winged helix-turn-helix domain-containing protein [Thermoplasmata archaeon]